MFARENELPVLHVAVRENALHLFRSGAWEDVGNGSGPEPEMIRNVLAGVLFARGGVATMNAADAHRDPRRARAPRRAARDRRRAHARDRRAAATQRRCQEARLARPAAAAHRGPRRSACGARARGVARQPAQQHGRARHAGRGLRVPALAAGLGRGREALRPLRPRRGAHRPLDRRRLRRRLPHGHGLHVPLLGLAYVTEVAHPTPPKLLSSGRPRSPSSQPLGPLPVGVARRIPPTSRTP